MMNTHTETTCLFPYFQKYLERIQSPQFLLKTQSFATSSNATFTIDGLPYKWLRPARTKTQPTEIQSRSIMKCAIGLFLLSVIVSVAVGQVSLPSQNLSRFTIVDPFWTTLTGEGDQHERGNCCCNCRPAISEQQRRPTPAPSSPSGS